MPLVGDRVRSASRPHRSLRRLRRRLFASAPPPMHQPSHAPGPAAAGRRYRRALVKSSPDASPRCAPDLVALHPRPHLSPPSSPPPPMIPIRSVSLRRSQRCAERHNLLRKWRILKQKWHKSLAGLRPAPRDKMTFRLGARPDLRETLCVKPSVPSALGADPDPWPFVPKK